MEITPKQNASAKVSVHTYETGKGNPSTPSFNTANAAWTQLWGDATQELDDVIKVGVMASGILAKAQSLLKMLQRGPDLRIWDKVHPAMLDWHPDAYAEGQAMASPPKGYLKKIDGVRVKLDILNDMLDSYYTADTERSSSVVEEIMKVATLDNGNGLVTATYTSSSATGEGIPAAAGQPYIYNFSSDSSNPADAEELMEHIAAEVGVPIYLHALRPILENLYATKFAGKNA